MPPRIHLGGRVYKEIVGSRSGCSRRVGTESVFGAAARCHVRFLESQNVCKLYYK